MAGGTHSKEDPKVQLDTFRTQGFDDLTIAEGSKWNKKATEEIQTVKSPAREKPSSMIFSKFVFGVLLLAVAFSSGTSVYFYQQQIIAQTDRTNNLVSQNSSLQNQQSSLQGQIDALNKQLGDLQSQLASLDGKLSQLQSSQDQVTQLQAQISQLESQIAQVQDQRDQLKAQIESLNRIIGLQNSRVMANNACTFWDCPSGTASGSQIGNFEFITLSSSIQYAGYLRVTWSSPSSHVSFGIQVYDVNITTPVQLSGVFSIPVAANATGNVWFMTQLSDCQSVPAGLFCPPVTYTITYWY